MQLKSILFDNPKLSSRKYILATVVIVLLLTFVFRPRNNRLNQNTFNAFVLIDEGLVKSTANFVAKNETYYMIFYSQNFVHNFENENFFANNDFRNIAYMVKDWADQLYYDLQELKVEIIKSCDGDNAPSLTPIELYIGEKREKKPTYNIDGYLIKGRDNINTPAKLMIYKGKGEELRKKIENYKDFLISKTDDPTVKDFFMNTLNTEPRLDILGTHITWESYHFENLPMIAVIANLSKMQNDIRIAETDILQDLLARIGASDTRVNRMEAVVVPKSRYVTKGDEFEARILLAAYDTLRKPQILIGPFHRTETGDYEIIGEGKLLPYDARGLAIYKTTTTSVGIFALQGLMQIMTPDGILNYPFYSEYQVGESKVP